jgi:hypothetical protein
VPYPPLRYSQSGKHQPRRAILFQRTAITPLTRCLTFGVHSTQELYAIERIALTQQALLRAARLETGLFTTCLNESLDPAGNPVVLMNEELAGDGDIEITRAQNRNYLLGEGFHRMARQSNSWSLVLRYQAQAERHYRRAVEEFERLKALRPELSNEPVFEAQPEQKETTCTPSETNPFPPENPAPAAPPVAGIPAAAIGALGTARKAVRCVV